MSVPYHVSDFQVLNADYGVQAYIQICNFVKEVLTLICNFLMSLRNEYTRLMSAIRAFLLTGKASASTSKYLLTMPIVFRILNSVAFAVDEETLNTYVNANFFRRFRKLFDRHVITGKGNKPTGTFAAHCDSLDFAFNWTGQIELKTSYVSDMQIAPVKFPTGLLECERIIPAKTFESRKASLPFAGLNPLKETLVCLIKAFKNLLQYLRAYGFKFRVFGLEFRKLAILLVHRNSLSELFICKNSNAKSHIVEDTAKFKPLDTVSLCSLIDFGFIEKGFTHLYLSLILNILFDYSQWSTAHCGNEITVCPKRRQPAFEMFKLLSKDSGTIAFYQFDKFMYAELRVYLDKQRYMVWHDFHFDDVCPNVQCFLLNELFKPVYNSINKNFAPILWTPDNMVFAGIHNVVIRLKLNALRHFVLYNLEVSNCKGYNLKACLISPCLKAGALRHILFAGMTKKENGMILLEFICSALPVISMFFILSFQRTDCVIIAPPFLLRGGRSG
ncbi:hypothetical protein ASN18_2207 [Candidatus Magnetominusculus xianensis]|uniref:Uncharacterized protein n=1 Tax=Candidatus Magnetominusculus xianensis TaxID=1748249 RepID=A0ABR5SHM3_9BACT|nr:hypothetical protein ASN18_2207 [Candidatus Magnetominusculus xianensis]